MQTLILGGTAWLGGTVAATAIERGHQVTCLARGQAGRVPAGAQLVSADRSDPTAYDEVRDREWDLVIEVSWQPGFVRSALTALGPRAAQWSYVSSCSVYADQSQLGNDESAPVLPALDGDVAERDEYGEAKVACELISAEAIGDRLLVARAGLIGGPGDISDRTGYWPARFASPATDSGDVLVPDHPDQPVQIIDVRDLAQWLVVTGEDRTVGTYNTVGPMIPLGPVLDAARAAAGHTGSVVAVDSDWLAGQGVEEYMGPESLPLWLHDPAFAGFSSRDAAAATGQGLTSRPVEDTLADVLTWEREQGLDRSRRAGLSPARERELLAAWAAR